MKLWPRLCFYTCLWFCSQGGLWAGRPPPDRENPLAGRNPPRPGRPPQPGRTPWTRENSPSREEPPSLDQADPPPAPPLWPGRHLPRQGEPRQTRQTHPQPGRALPGSRLQNTVYERPVRILLECILVCSNTILASMPEWSTLGKPRLSKSFWLSDRLVFGSPATRTLECKF